MTVICARCAHAVDNQLGEDAHCGSTGGPDAACFCQHRTDRYGTAARHTTADTSQEVTRS